MLAQPLPSPEFLGQFSVCLSQLCSRVLSEVTECAGGAITRDSTWKWVFLLNAPVGFVAIIALLISWPSSVRSFVIRKFKISDVDWLGAILLLCASVMLVFALQEAGATAYAWSSPTIIATLTVSAAC